MKRQNKSFFISVLFVGAIISVVFWPVSNWIKMLSAFGFLFLFIYLRRSFIYFYRAVELLKAGGMSNEVIKNFDKAIELGIDVYYQRIIGELLIQHGEKKRGNEILERMKDSRRKNG